MEEIIVREFENTKDAKKSFVKIDKTYNWVMHRLKTNKAIRPHYHPKANEWVLVSNCIFAVAEYGQAPVIYRIHNKAALIYIPLYIKHWFKALEKMEYEVYRDQKDRNIYCDHPERKKINGKPGQKNKSIDKKDVREISKRCTYRAS